MECCFRRQVHTEALETDWTVKAAAPLKEVEEFLSSQYYINSTKESRISLRNIIKHHQIQAPSASAGFHFQDHHLIISIIGSMQRPNPVTT